MPNVIDDVLIDEVKDLLAHLPSLTSSTPCLQQSSHCALSFTSTPPALAVLSYDKRLYNTLFDLDLKVYQDMELILEQGSYYANMLYAFRSVSRAIPAMKEDDPTRKKVFNIKTFEVLSPEMDKLKELLTFTTSASTFFTSILTRLCTLDSGTSRDLFCGLLIAVLDVLQKIDNLKDMKACLQNDFAAYKRAFHLVRNDIPAADITQEDIQQLQMFLGNPYHPKLVIVNQLREQCKLIPKHTEVLLEMIHICCDRIEKGIHVTPDEKYSLHRVLAYLVFMIDDPGKNSFNAFKARKLPLTRVQKIIRALPVIPQIGDMTLNLPAIITLSPNYQQDKMSSQWGAFPAQPVKDYYSLPTHWQRMRDTHTSFTCKFATMTTNEGLAELLSDVKGERTIEAMKVRMVDPKYVVEKVGPLYEAVLEGVKLISQWTSNIQEMSAWKFQHPATVEEMTARGYNPKVNDSPNALPFEMAVRYNFDKSELSVLTDCISMIKSLAALLLAKEARVAPLLRVYMHSYVQKFVGIDLKPLVDKADKKGRPIGAFLKNITDLVADYVDMSASSSKSLRKAIKDLKDPSSTQKHYNTRFVAPGAAQLHLLRSMVRSMNDMNGRGHYVADCKDTESMRVLDKFYIDTHYFAYLGSLASSIQQSSHLGDLWYRELYIEITKCTQFPIEMSLPFILVEHVVHNIDSSVPLLENVAYIMDVYNDAAFWALQTLQVQHLYDELEAEVNLVFDQAVFMVGEAMYSHFKNHASSMLLDRNYKEAIELGKGYKQLSVEEKRFSTVAKQHHILLLGRSIDLNFLIATHLNHKLSKDIETVIKRFEGSDLSNILEIEKMLEVVELTHAKLAELLVIDSFSDMFANANADVNAVNVCGRIIAHMKTTVIEDVVVNYALNMHTQRFKRSPIAFKQTGREGRPKLLQTSFAFGTQCGKAWDYYCNLSRGFIGRPHIDAMVRMVGEAGINFIMAFFMEHIEERMASCKTVIKGLSDGLPPIKLPKVVFGTAGCFGMFEARLKQYFQYMDFLDESFQMFREIGNVVGFVGMLDSSLALRQTNAYVNAAGFLGARCSGKVSEFPIGLARNQSGRSRAESEVGNERRVVVEADKKVDHALFEFDDVRSGFQSVSQTFVELAHATEGRVRAPKVVHDFVAMSERAHDAYAGLTSTPNLNIGKDLIDSISAVMDKVGFRECLGVDEGPESVMSSERTDEFHRVFSVLNFLMCMEHKSRGEEEEGAGAEVEKPTTDGAVFGHGFGLAGVVFLHILGQGEKFRLLDLSYHVLKVHEQQEDMKWRTEGVGGKGGGAEADELSVSANKFVAEARAMQELHEHIFGMIEMNVETREEATRKVGENSKFLFLPPDDDRDLKNMGDAMHILLHKHTDDDDE